jgi:hypothetical protein
MSEYNQYINHISNNLKISKKDDINFDLVFDSLMNFCLKFNNYKFGKNYSKSKYFIHIWGGASLKYKMNRYGLNVNNITSDIDVVFVPFENNPNIRIKLVEKFIYGLKKELPNYMWRYTIDNMLVRIYLNNIKIFDVVFYDKIRPWYLDFKNDNMIIVIKKLNLTVDEYFENLKKMFEYDLVNQEILEKVTFTSLEFDYYTILLLMDMYDKKYIDDIKKLKEENANPIKIYEQKKFIKNKMVSYKKKLFYLTHMMTHNNCCNFSSNIISWSTKS